MVPRLAALLLLFPLCATVLPAIAAAPALDLGEAARKGALVAEALERGREGNWEDAAAVVAPEGDPLLEDIVLWRKLRSGDGTLAEYDAFRTRRWSWPGQTALAEAVIGTLPRARPVRPLNEHAARNWAAFERTYERGDYDEAERLLEQITVSEVGLGRPTLWAGPRRRLVRRAAREGRSLRAYRLASQHYLAPGDGYAYADLEWLSGWVALRLLEDPARAVPHFQRFHAVVETPISLGRGGYWLGRAYAARGDSAEAFRWYAAAAAHQTSFYGQLAAAEIGAEGDPRLTRPALPDWRKSPALRDDDVRMAVILHFAGDEALAFQSFTHLAKTLPGEAALGALADLALDLGRPHYAVRVAKKAARRGVILHKAYYPVTDLAGYSNLIEPALAMSIARQETELNPRAISPAGARGLMQLMPSTARKVARKVGEKYVPRLLDRDWQYNARLGQAYMAEQIADFGGSYVLAAAAYNAGPAHAKDWIADYGDPRLARVDVIDWIERIPFRETRNYVQRVMEGLYVYRVRLSGTAGPMTLPEDLARGAP